MKAEFGLSTDFGKEETYETKIIRKFLKCYLEIYAGYPDTGLLLAKEEVKKNHQRFQFDFSVQYMYHQAVLANSECTLA